MSPSEREEPEDDLPQDLLGALRPGGMPSDGPALDPDAAIIEAERRHPRSPAPVIDTRKYQWMIGGFGLTLVVAFSIYLFVHGGGGSGSVGVPAGQRLHPFVAPLATSDLNASANAHPVCNPARPSRRGLNVCDRRPIVLAFFVTGSHYRTCAQQVDTLQAVSDQFPKVQFAAVAVGASQAATAKLVRQHHWTIPVAYDSSDAIGEVYGVEVCPLIEIAKAGGIVQQRLIGKAWLGATSLAKAVAKLGG